MARIDDKTEERMSEARARRRQDKNCPLLIRDDGMLFPNVPLVAKKPNFRPYRGDPKASLEDRLAYLQGFGQRRRVNYDPSVEEEPFDLTKASADEIIAFAMEEYGAALDAETPLPELRAECYRLSQLPIMELPIAKQQGGQDGASTGMGTAAPAPAARKTSGRRSGTAAV